MLGTQIFSAVLIFLLPAVRSQTNYNGRIDFCNLYDCGTQHIACESNEKPPSSCPREAKLVDMKNQRRFIVNLHNINRNRVANGVYGLRRAARMATMRWDRTLAHVAQQTVLQCRIQTDLCHNTPMFQHSGQNAVMHGTSKNDLMRNLKALIEMDIATWFNQSIAATRSIVKSYHDSHDGRIFGHFTLVANERNTHVGCAGIQFPDGGYLKFLFLCNYATNNIKGMPVYKTCPIAGCKCRSGKNSLYPNLCSLEETYDYNYSS